MKLTTVTRAIDKLKDNYWQVQGLNPEADRLQVEIIRRLEQIEAEMLRGKTY